jgi:hypothetical protein
MEVFLEVPIEVCDKTSPESRLEENTQHIVKQIRPITPSAQVSRFRSSNLNVQSSGLNCISSCLPDFTLVIRGDEN